MGLDEFKPGATLDGKYHILDKVGFGGMGTVVKAERLTDRKVVAIKYCHRDDNESIRRFGREVRIAVDIVHPNVVEVIDVQLDKEPPYFVMPYAESSLDKRLDALSKDEDMALDAFTQLCEGVQAIHNSGAFHRDIKPGNGLIFADGTVVLADFGLAKLSKRDTTILTKQRHVIGTERYLAPEQRIDGGSRDADERTDIFQLGKTLYELVTGLNPALIDPSALPPGLQHAVRRATEQHPDERYQTVGELLDGVNIYRVAKDPEANPIGAYEAVVTQIQERVARHQYRAKDLRKALQLLAQESIPASGETYLELVDRLPQQILPNAATLAANDFRPVLKAYVQALDDAVGNQAFPYADSVAKRMRIIYESTDDTDIRTLALEAVLVASVRLNRFSAMGIFDRMLLLVTSDSDAYPVREMLDRREPFYRELSNRIPSIKLHPVIRGLADQLNVKDEQ